MMKNNAFNNSVDSGLRILCILNEFYPTGFDLQTLIYLDYITIHSRDFGSELLSLHPDVPYRTGEIFVRRTSIKQGLELYHAKGLIHISYQSDGLIYLASENSNHFIETLQEEYTVELLKRTKWLSKYLSEVDKNTLKNIIESKTDKINLEFKIGLLK
jgi:hypothetical protein